MPALLLSGFGSAAADSLENRWQSEVFPLVEFYCYDCHGDGLSKGELDLDRFESIADMRADRGQWQRIRDHLRQRLMPPVDEMQPTSEERERIVGWIDDAVFPVDPENPDPGRVTLRRLNRVEYENTLRDLLGVRVEIGDLLPPDDSGYGFDNIGDVLTLSPAHLERFLITANRALDKALHPGPMPFPRQTVGGGKFAGSGRPAGDIYELIQNGRASATFGPGKPGRYRLIVHAAGTRGGGEGPRMVLHDDSGDALADWEVTAGPGEPARHAVEFDASGLGSRTFSVAFTNDFYNPDDPDPDNRDRNLFIHRLELEGPLDGPRLPKPESHRKIYGERDPEWSDATWATDVFARFARRAFRRPPRPGEAERYLHFVRLARDEDLGVEHGIARGLEAMLVSPAFLFREEPQPEPDNADRIHPIDEHALASRLSYFLWSTMPDERLMRLADRGELRANLDDEIGRMLEDPKARRFVENFGGQWLQIRDLRHARPSRRAFPDFNHALRGDMMRETQMLIEHMLAADRPLTDLLLADYTFVNERLARHYGIEGVEGGEFRKVSLADTPRRGLLGHGSFLLVTSHPLRTSPVLRGKYVLENLLDTAPPPPPPNVPQLTSPSKHGEGASLREQLEKHREDPACASCHNLMDPIGFGLENFAADGSWRTEENGKPINASGELIDGQAFAGAEELRQILAADHEDDFLRAVASKMLTYALGRGTQWYDQPALDEIVRETRESGLSTRAMVRAVIASVPFQYRRGDG